MDPHNITRKQLGPTMEITDFQQFVKYLVLVS